MHAYFKDIWLFVTGDDSFLDIVTHLKDLTKSDITKLGVQFGLSYRWLQDKENSENYLYDVVLAWLTAKDNVQQTCPPTWSNLEKALRRIGQNGVADNIAREH